MRQRISVGYWVLYLWLSSREDGVEKEWEKAKGERGMGLGLLGRRMSYSARLLVLAVGGREV